MSRYAINSLLYRLKKDRPFRDNFNRDPRGTLADLDLTEAERSAFLARDMYRINQLGGYLHLTMSIPGMAVHVTHEDIETQGDQRQEATGGSLPFTG